MGAFWSRVIVFLKQFFGYALKYAGPMLLQAATFFGVAFVTKKYAMQPFVALIQSSLSGAPAMVIKALASVKFDQAVTIILSAYIVAAGKRLVMQRIAAASGGGGGVGP